MTFRQHWLHAAIALSILCWTPVEVNAAPPSSPVQAATSGFPLFEYESSHLDEQSLGNFGVRRPVLDSGECRTFPGEADWPSDQEWDSFDDLLGGALIPTVPIGAPCYQNWGVFDKEKCAAVTKNFPNPYFHEADPTSTMWPLWQGKTCLPMNNANGTCTLGGYPTYAVNVSNVAQIQHAVNFALTKNIRLVIKNTGHCYLGKSNGAGSLSVWTHHFKDIAFLPDYHSATYRGAALKVGAGVTVREVYNAAHQYGSVGFAGGYLAGGGHTPLSGLYGMAADQVLGFEVVTADGRFVTANETSNPDLFWALRGGGGSTFGIVTSATVRVHPRVKVVTSTFTFGVGPSVSNETFWEGIRAYFELFIPFTDAGTYSWYSINSTGGAPVLDMHPFFAPNHTIESFNQLVKPWFDKLQALGIPFTPNTTYYDDYLPAYNDQFGIKDAFGKDSVGRYTSMPGNRLFPRANWEDPAKFNDTFDLVQKHGEAGHVILGYHQAPRNRLNADNAVSSAWRNTIAFLITNAPVAADATPAQMTAAHEEINAILEPWRQVAPASEGGGSYLNEAHVMEPNWQQEFYGDQYAELLRLKHKWDPSNVFYATTGVGSEAWEVRTREQGVQTQNGRLCRL
ncbi:uncharacterized protein JN550_007556 [Neoarthrinium moseri]|uniref:uncharacterized protein n=1 Tax=Neoarthrinium moseri TaxID=1658444 RepID=UPI001FDB7DB5|nr:uncharacterized protein JN550_007556 [Neoarthrinium moseri]KAI1866703.1 hypothetical protein JN550_007556 [Neoarthrinium moseri]